MILSLLTVHSRFSTFPADQQMMQASLIVKEPTQRLFLQGLLSPHGTKAELLYRGSTDTFTRKAFHHKCDGKGSTVSLFLTDTDRRCGGFTAQSWHSRGEYTADPHAFLFSLDSLRFFPVQDPLRAIYGSNDYGPSFGWSIYGYDLSARDEPFNEKGKCRSFPNNFAYRVPADKQGGSLLTGKDR